MFQIDPSKIKRSTKPMRNLSHDVNITKTSGLVQCLSVEKMRIADFVDDALDITLD